MFWAYWLDYVLVTVFSRSCRFLSLCNLLLHFLVILQKRVTWLLLSISLTLRIFILCPFFLLALFILVFGYCSLSQHLVIATLLAALPLRWLLCSGLSDLFFLLCFTISHFLECLFNLNSVLSSSNNTSLSHLLTVFVVEDHAHCMLQIFKFFGIDVDDAWVSDLSLLDKGEQDVSS